MKINWVEVGLFAFCILLLGLSIVQFFMVDFLGKENAALSEELAGTNAELAQAQEEAAAQKREINSLRAEMAASNTALESKLNSEVASISMDLNATKARITIVEEDFLEFQEQYVELQQDYNQKVEEYSQLMLQLEDFEDDLQEKMYWYSANADFGGKTKGFLSRIETKCVDGNTLVMPCVSIVLENRSFSYISEGKDYIKSLDEFEDDEGGDCEDWSIFVKAIINELVDEEGIDELALVEYGTSGYFEVYEDDGVTYYYTNEPVYVDIENVQVACFPLSGYEGHCALVSDDVLFEPQDGSYLSGLYWNEEEYLIEKGGIITVLIDNEDLAIYGEDGWISYAYFIEKMDEIIGEN